MGARLGMSPNFIAKSTVAVSDLLAADGVPVLERFEFLRDRIISLAGRDAAALFAEPIITRRGGEAEIAWYTERQGDPIGLSSLDAEARKNVGAKLTKHLAAIEPLLRDPAAGPILVRALHIPEPSDIVAIGGEPAFIRWGVAGSQTNVALAAQFSTTLGPYSPFPPPPMNRPPDANAPASPPTSAAPIGAPRGGRRWDLPSRGLASGTGVAAVVALFMTLPGVLAPQAAIMGDGGLSVLRQSSQATADKLAKAQAALDAANCNPDGSFTTPSGVGQLPPRPIPVKPQEAIARGDKRIVVQLSAQSVVFVIACTDEQGFDEEHKDDKEKPNPEENKCPLDSAQAKSDDGGSTKLLFAGAGSGFYIGRNTIVTNQHVVAGSKAVFVMNRFLGGAEEGRVLADKIRAGLGRPDFAIIHAEGDRNPPTIPLSDNVELLEDVVSAGFPGVVIRGASEIESGKHGGGPEVVTVHGEVSNILNPDSDMPTILSTATIGHGNSGGPLLDFCGRAVGVNTWGWSGEEGDSGYKVNAAQGAKGLMEFLDDNNIAYQKSSGPCEPQSASAAPPVPSGPQPTAPPTGK